MAAKANGLKNAPKGNAKQREPKGHGTPAARPVKGMPSVSGRPAANC